MGACFPWSRAVGFAIEKSESIVWRRMANENLYAIGIDSADASERNTRSGVIEGAESKVCREEQ